MSNNHLLFIRFLFHDSITLSSYPTNYHKLNQIKFARYKKMNPHTPKISKIVYVSIPKVNQATNVMAA